MAAERDFGSTPNPRGRPRIWENEAERKRAYRERKAAELAAPERLRQELREERKRVAAGDREIARLRRQLQDAQADLAASEQDRSDLEEQIASLRAQLVDWKGRARALATYRQERQRAGSPGRRP
jgi:chromosome segregation ATPase